MNWDAGKHECEGKSEQMKKKGNRYDLLQEIISFVSEHNEKS